METACARVTFEAPIRPQAPAAPHLFLRAAACQAALRPRSAPTSQSLKPGFLRASAPPREIQGSCPPAKSFIAKHKTPTVCTPNSAAPLRKRSVQESARIPTNAVHRCDPPPTSARPPCSGTRERFAPQEPRAEENASNGGSDLHKLTKPFSARPYYGPYTQVWVSG